MRLTLKTIFFVALNYKVPNLSRVDVLKESGVEESPNRKTYDSDSIELMVAFFFHFCLDWFAMKRYFFSCFLFFFFPF